MRLAPSVSLVVAAAAAGATAVRAWPGDPPPERDLPGRVAGRRLHAGWIAPYVYATSAAVNAESAPLSVVRWFAPDGTTLRDVRDVRDVRDGVVTIQPGFVSVREGDVTAFHATNASWTVQVPDLKGTPGGAAVSGDGSTLLRTWTLPDGKIAAELYVDGKFAVTLGPLSPWRAENFVLGDDGAVAVLAAPADAKTPLVTAFARGGKPSFEAAVAGDARLVAVAPGGSGVVVRLRGRDSADEFTWVAKDGAPRTVKLGQNARIAAWEPRSARAVCATSDGAKERFLLVDWEKGETRWAADDPATSPTEHEARAVAVDGDYVLLSGEEMSVGGWTHRIVHALDLEGGTLAGTWTSDAAGPCRPRARFQRAGGTLYLVADDVFAAFPSADVRSKANGWR